MSAQTILEARLRGRDDGLVGQLNATERSSKSAAGGLKELASAAGGTASASARLSTETAGAAREQGNLAQSSSRAVVALGAEQRALDAAATAAARKRAGMQQLGFQAQDFFVQIGSGASVLTAFSQQASQATGALALMGSGGTAATGIMGRFVSLMGGPFGIAIGIAIPLVSMLASKLFETADASKAAELGASGLASAQSVLGEIFDLTSGKIKQQNDLLILNARLMAINLRSEAAQAKLNSEQGIADAKDAPLGALERFMLRAGGASELQLSAVQMKRTRIADLASGVQQGALSPSEAVRLAGELNFKGTGIEKSEFLAVLRDTAVAKVKEDIANEIDKTLDSGELSSAFLKPGTSGRKGEKSGGSRASAGAARALANFGDSAVEKVQRIADAYNPAPSGLDKAFADLRTLDGLIADLGQRKPPSFEKLIGEAKTAREAVLAGIAEPLDTIQQRLVPLPEGVVKARAAIEELDGVIAVLSERKPPNWQELVERAEQLKDVAADSVNGPFNDMVRASREQREQQLLILQGREREAEVLARIQQLTRAQGPLTADQRRTVEAIVAAEERINELMQKRQDIISIQMAAIGDLRGALEDLFSGGSGGDFLSATKRMVQQYSGRMLVENLFGDSLRALEKKARGQTPLDREIVELASKVDGLERETDRAGMAAKLFAAALADATGKIWGADANPAHILADGSANRVSGGDAASGDDIVVNGTRVRSPFDRARDSMREQFDFVRGMVGSVATPVLDGLDKIFGAKFFGKMEGAVSGGLAGLLTMGPVGGILGVAKELPGLPDEMKKSLGKAFEGAQTGTIVAGVSKMLGFNTSTTGSQVGGAIGSLLPIPGGSIIGSVAGGILGGLFKKAPKGAAVITSAEEGGYSVSGNKSGVRQNLTTASTSVQDALLSIADMLDASVGQFRVSIGEYKGWYRVSASGSGNVGDKKYPKWAGSDLVYDGQDAAAAVQAALRNAIADGAVTGISGAMQRALQSSSDVDKAVAEALKVREVEDILSGLGGTLERQFREFEAQAKERVRIATQYGFDVTKIEAHNAEERAKLVSDILSSRVGSLQQLLEDLSFGALFEGSAAERRDKLITEIATAKGDAEKGVDGAADRLAELTRLLVETSREAYGTAGSEYAGDRASAIGTAEAIIAAENERIRAAQQATMDTSKALQTQNALTNETNDMLAEIRAILRSMGGSGDLSALGLSAAVARQVSLI